MGLIRRGGGGGGGDEGGGSDSLGLDDEYKRCETCRRELLPWQDTCPDDGGRAVSPGALAADHDPLLARLLAEDDDADQPGAGDADRADAGDADDAGRADAGDASGGHDDEPSWPQGPAAD